MKANLDESVYFDSKSFRLKVNSWQRNYIERSGIGLDGTVSIDMGLSKRVIVQSGRFAAASLAEASEMIEAVNGMFGGAARTLSCPDGRVFENLRIDGFSTDDVTAGNLSSGIKYEIIYTQLG